MIWAPQWCKLEWHLLKEQDLSLWKKGSQNNSWPETMNLTQNLKHNSTLPTKILLLRTNPSMAQVAFHIFVFLYNWKGKWQDQDNSYKILHVDLPSDKSSSFPLITLDPEFSLYAITILRVVQHSQIQFQGIGRGLKDNMNMMTVRMWAMKHALWHRKLDGVTKADSSDHSARYCENKMPLYL